MNCVRPLVGAIVGFVVGLLLVVLWESAGPQTTVLVAQTLVLAATLFCVYKYVLAATEQSRATRRLADAALEDRASILVVEYDDKGLETVGACKKKGIEIKGLTDDPDKHDWLIIEIRNEGKRTAHNVRATASWEEREEPASTNNAGWMANDQCALGDYSGNIRDHWRVWKLLADESRFFYFPPPGECDNNAHIKFTWYDPLYYPWTNQVTIVKKDCQWYTQWNDVATPVQHWRLAHGD